MNMEVEELRKIIEGSPAKDWFNNLEITISYPHIKFVQNLKGYATIYSFFKQQAEGWEKWGTDVPGVLHPSRNQFVNESKTLVDFLVQNKMNAEHSVARNWGSFTAKIYSNNHRFFTYDCPETTFLIQVNKSLPNAINGAYFFLIDQTTNQPLDKNNLTGYFLAYEFTRQENSDIFKRGNEEANSLNELKLKLQKFVFESEEKTNTFFKAFKTSQEGLEKDFSDLRNTKNEIWEKWRTEKIDEATALGEKFTLSQSNKENLFDDWLKASKDKMADLEKTYQEKLRLEKPAEFWNKRAVKLKSNGYWSLGSIGVLVGVATILLFVLLANPPEAMMKGFLGGDPGAIKWSIVFITFISFMAFGIRVLSKITFSNFHLARDAEEREQLTYVYLAMVKDETIDHETKLMIMQSLFSRADTGLLKEDSSPTMPGGIVERFLPK